VRIVLAILLSCGIALQAFASDGKISVPMRTTFNADKDVKIVLDSLEIFMSRDAIVKYLKQVQRNGGSNTKVLRKKMKGALAKSTYAPTFQTMRLLQSKNC
jgi:hypothetical protein